MAPDLRVKAAVRPPRQREPSDSEEAFDSDEEWVDSPEEGADSAEESSSTSRSTSKQRRSDASDHPHVTQSDEQPVVLAPPLEKFEFPSWDALDGYLKSYSADTYQASFDVLDTIADAVSNRSNLLIVLSTA
ncbi:hypothetical protein PR003_g16806 [Phytophthora rubi]|uniref:Uncharacterized protein n=1 Tax=Phytophthora rubi TaxID=129364 RepID=A0A6A4EDJ9_9STRA|nr:hypothetical protein PR002_g16428 [Phytophthora rubi]KAE9324167.1 hypothetical protein PR003_g16806 [Phytophthora rubi]